MHSSRGSRRLGRFAQHQPASPIFPNVESGYVRSDAADQLRGDLEAVGKPKTVDGLNITIHATR